ncbi:hypothetical protein ACCD04_10190 [Telluria sp. Tellsp131]|uniref:hypothetical protein n=1 Tax=Massilia sp. CT11-108 TaxID=3393900 RepID=UPI0039A64552
MAQATTLQPGQIRHLLRVTAAASRHPERDSLILLLGLTAGMRVTEIAQIEVQDVLFQQARCAPKSAYARRSRKVAGSVASTLATPRPSRRLTRAWSIGRLGACVRRTIGAAIGA